MGGQMVSVYPDELSFVFELEQQSYCNLKLVNHSEHNVAFKIKTTAPKKYFVRPNTGVIPPWDSVVILVTLQAQHEYPPDLHCRDKFLVQSAIMPPNVDPDAIPPEIFNKDTERKLEEHKLRVVYTSPSASNGPRSLEDHLLLQASMLRSSRHTDSNSMQSGGNSHDCNALVHIRQERDAALRQQKQLQQEPLYHEIFRKSQLHKGKARLSLKVTIIVGIMDILIGYILNLTSSISSHPNAHADI